MIESSFIRLKVTSPNNELYIESTFSLKSQNHNNKLYYKAKQKLRPLNNSSSISNNQKTSTQLDQHGIQESTISYALIDVPRVPYNGCFIYEHFPPTFLQNICENRSKGDVVFVINITKIIFSVIFHNAFKYPKLERTRK